MCGTAFCALVMKVATHSHSGWRMTRERGSVVGARLANDAKSRARLHRRIERGVAWKRGDDAFERMIEGEEMPDGFRADAVHTQAALVLLRVTRLLADHPFPSALATLPVKDLSGIERSLEIEGAVERDVDEGARKTRRATGGSRIVRRCRHEFVA